MKLDVAIGRDHNTNQTKEMEDLSSFSRQFIFLGQECEVSNWDISITMDYWTLVGHVEARGPFY